MLCAKAGAQHTCLKAVKAALSYIAAGSCNGCGLHYMTPTFMSIGTTAIELHVFKKKKKKKKKNMDKMGKTFWGIIFTFGALLPRFLVYCLVFTYKVP